MALAAKKQQVIAGKLGWPLRRIEQATGVRRETASAYLKAAGVTVRLPGGGGRRMPAKPANGVTTDSDSAKPTITVNPETPSCKEKAETAKPANEVTTDPGSSPARNQGLPTHPERSASACEPHRELIEQGLGRGRNAMAIWQDLVSDHGFTGSYQREAFRSQTPRSATARSGRHHPHRSRRRSPGRLRQWADGARSAEWQISPDTTVRVDSRL